MQPHKHQALIIQWANGEKIQYRKPNEEAWKDSDTPAWVEDYEYRVKPVEPERVYPVTRMTEDQVHKLFSDLSMRFNTKTVVDLLEMINFGLRHAIDAGQVVTREEFDKLAAINATLRKAIPINFD